MTQDPPESAVKADLNAWVDGSTSQPNSVELASGSSVNPSKRALKRQRKLEAAQQRKQDPEFQAERRKRRKEEKQRRAEKVRDGLLPPKIRNKNERQLAPYRLVVDLSFNHLMTGKEQVSTASQLAICYALNRKTPCPVKMVFTPIESEVKAALDQQRPEWQTGWTGPGRNLTCGSAGQHFSTISVDGGTVPLLDPPYDPANTVYLSADAPETLLTLKEGETYIIGGLVDRNRHKNLCRNEAERLGLRTARLPIDDYFKLTGRKVLAINHVVEILLNWMHSKDWQQAILSAIPQRHEPTLLDENNQESSSEKAQKDDENKKEPGDTDEGLRDAIVAKAIQVDNQAAPGKSIQPKTDTEPE